MTELHDLTLSEGLRAVAKGETFSSEIAAACLAEARRRNDVIGAYLWLPETVAPPANTTTGPLAGLPIAVKDNIVVRGVPTTAGSRILEGYVPPYDATVWTRLRSAGATLLGKTNLDEFAMGSSNENSAYRPVHNPVDTTRVPGGSSGGSAAAVAARMAPAALGSDTGGSIRQPAAFCGVVGFKPTYGMVSRYGLIAFASSLDQIGPITRSVEDAAFLTGILAHGDPRDSTSVDLDRGKILAPAARAAEWKNLRIGLPKEYLGEGIDPEVRSAIEDAARAAAREGARVVPVSLPHTPHAVATYYLVATAECSSNLARFDGIRYGPREARATLDETYGATRGTRFGREVRRRILLGTFVLSAGYADAYYKKALCVRTLIKNDFDAAWKDCDLLLTPTAPTTAFRIGEKTADPLQMYLSDICTIPANLAGLPAISIPAGRDKKNLPIGLQLIGRAFEDGALLAAARSFETLLAEKNRPDGTNR